MRTFLYDLDLVEQAMSTYVCNIEPTRCWDADEAAQAMSDVQLTACRQQLLAAGLVYTSIDAVANYDDVSDMRIKYTNELEDLINTYAIMREVAIDVEIEIEDGILCNSFRVELAERLHVKYGINVVADGALVEDFYCELVSRHKGVNYNE
jgi:hypothetical protein